MIEPMTGWHAPDVLEIYQAGLDSGLASFETVAPGWAVWDSAHLPEHRFVAVDAGRVVGWVACTPTSGRRAYAGVVESSVYVAPAQQRCGVGRELLAAVIASTERAGIWTLEAVMFPDNPASWVLHRSMGFRLVGRRERIGRRNGTWCDTLLLERRSPVVT